MLFFFWCRSTPSTLISITEVHLLVMRGSATMFCESNQIFIDCICNGNNVFEYKRTDTDRRECYICCRSVPTPAVKQHVVLGTENVVSWVRSITLISLPDYPTWSNQRRHTGLLSGMVNKMHIPLNLASLQLEPIVIVTSGDYEQCSIFS